MLDDELLVCSSVTELTDDDSLDELLLWVLSLLVELDDWLDDALLVLVDDSVDRVDVLEELWELMLDVLDELSELCELSVLVEELLRLLTELVLDDERVLSELVLLDDWLDSSAID